MSGRDGTQPRTPMVIAKVAVERDLRLLMKLFGLDYVIFRRPHKVYWRASK